MAWLLLIGGPSILEESPIIYKEKMKMKKLIAISVLAFGLVLSSNAIASTQAASTETKAAPKGVETKMNEMMYKGVIQLTGKGAELITLDKIYLLDGGDFSALAGQTVTIVGKLVKEGEQEKIVVDKLNAVNQ